MTPDKAHMYPLIVGGAKEMEKPEMSITVNLYYMGENGNTRKFAEEMEQSGKTERSYLI